MSNNSTLRTLSQLFSTKRPPYECDACQASVSEKVVVAYINDAQQTLLFCSAECEVFFTLQFPELVAKLKHVSKQLV